MKQRTAVVGFGCAGFHGVKSMRENGYRGEIDVFTDSRWAPANPMLTTYYIYGKLKKENVLPFGTLEELASRYKFRIVNEPVCRVLSREKGILLENGQIRHYDQILIATGASAFVPPIPGIDHKNVFTMRTLQDAEMVKAALERGTIKNVVVVGASMVGIKLVELLYARGIGVTLVDMAPYIFPVSAVPAIAEEIETRLREKGVELAFSKAMKSVENVDGRLQVVFGDGETISCDAVMMCIGTRANTNVVDEDIKVNRAVVVDMEMRTNMPDIYSAGDCCEGNNLQTGQTQIIGIWDNAARQGITAGINMSGGHDRYYGNMLHNITHFMGMDFIGYGDVRSEGTDYTYENKHLGQKFVVRMKDHIPVCMNLLDSYGASGVLKSYMLQRIEGKVSELSPVAKVRMIREGVPERMIRLLSKEIKESTNEKGN